MTAQDHIDEYQAFLARKHPIAEPSGFEPGDLPKATKPFQADLIRWSCRQGRSGIWAQVGLGKTLMQLAWAEQVWNKTGKNVLIVCPLAVARQTKREADKFGISTPVSVCRKQDDVRPGISITNYQMLKHFDEKEFGSVAIDESDILADFMGATKRLILSKFEHTPYKLDCSATPAPNEHMEIGNHSDFLGVMEGTEMLSRWFINDTMEAGAYRLKNHGQESFWRWVASWAAAITLPSDLGYEDEAYILPPINLTEHVVETDIVDGRSNGMLFRLPTMSATSMHGELKRTTKDRVQKALEIVQGIPKGDAVLIWCHTDYEADELSEQIPDAIEIRGSDKIEKKESSLDGFIDRSVRILIGKPSMFGHGLNLQHCHHMIFVGLDYSFKGFFQAIGRCRRFGQTHQVNVHVILASTEGRLLETIRRKQADYEEMQRQMVSAIMRYGLGSGKRQALSGYDPKVEMIIPSWLKGSDA